MLKPDKKPLNQIILEIEQQALDGENLKQFLPKDQLKEFETCIEFNYTTQVCMLLEKIGAFELEAVSVTTSRSSTPVSHHLEKFDIIPSVEGKIIYDKFMRTNDDQKIVGMQGKEARLKDALATITPLLYKDVRKYLHLRLDNYSLEEIPYRLSNDLRHRLDSAIIIEGKYATLEYLTNSGLIEDNLDLHALKIQDPKDMINAKIRVGNFSGAASIAIDFAEQELPRIALEAIGKDPIIIGQIILKLKKDSLFDITFANKMYEQALKKEDTETQFLMAYFLEKKCESETLFKKLLAIQAVKDITIIMDLAQKLNK